MRERDNAVAEARVWIRPRHVAQRRRAMCTTRSARRSLKPSVTTSRSTARRAGALPLFSQHLTGHLVFQEGLREQLLQPRVFDFELLQPLGVGHAHAAELVPPQVIAGLGSLSWRSGCCDLHRDTQVTQALKEPLRHAVFVALLKMVRTEVVILDTVAEHDIGGGERRKRARHPERVTAS